MSQSQNGEEMKGDGDTETAENISEEQSPEERTLKVEDTGMKELNPWDEPQTKLGSILLNRVVHG